MVKYIRHGRPSPFCSHTLRRCHRGVGRVVGGAASGVRGPGGGGQGGWRKGGGQVRGETRHLLDALVLAALVPLLVDAELARRRGPSWALLGLRRTKRKGNHKLPSRGGLEIGWGSGPPEGPVLELLGVEGLESGVEAPLRRRHGLRGDVEEPLRRPCLERHLLAANQEGCRGLRGGGGGGCQPRRIGAGSSLAVVHPCGRRAAGNTDGSGRGRGDGGAAPHPCLRWSKGGHWVRAGCESV